MYVRDLDVGFQRRFRDYLKREMVPFVESGWENWANAQFRAAFTGLGRSTVLDRIHYLPDFGVIIEKALWFIDTKNSGVRDKTISKDAYSAYRDLEELGYNVAVAYNNPPGIAVARVRDLRFVPDPVTKEVWRKGRDGRYYAVVDYAGSSFRTFSDHNDEPLPL